MGGARSLTARICRYGLVRSRLERTKDTFSYELGLAEALDNDAQAEPR
jgi:hypothetical protein